MPGSRVARLRLFDGSHAVAFFRASARALAQDRLRRRIPLAVVHLSVVILAATLLVRATPEWTVPPPSIFLGWVALLALAEIAPLPLPRGGFLTVSSAFDLAALVLFGPLATAWIDVTSGALVHGIVRPRPPARVLFNLAAYVVAAFAAAGAYRALGGRVGEFAFGAHDLAAYAAMGLTYFGVNTVLVSLVLAAEGGKAPWGIWQANFGWTLPGLAGFMTLGSLAALVHAAWGFPALALFLLPLLLARRAFSLHIRAEEDLVDFTGALAGTLEGVDPYTRRHSIRVAAYAERLARGLKLAEGEVRAIRLAGLLHDVGKMAQERALLQKPGPLDPDERSRIEAHPVAGAEILAQVRALRPVARLVRHHHERPDGGGYPERLKGEAIPLGSRVVLVADAFDAMTSDRPYRQAMSGDRAIAELSRHAGTQFDSRVVATLERLRAQGQFEIIHREVGDLDLRLIV